DAGGALADLTPLFFGAEGTLGIVTKAVLRIVPKPELTRPLTYSFPELPAAGRFLKAVVDTALTPYHAAVVDRDHFVFERALHSDTPEPVDLALVAVQGSKDEVADQEKALDALASKEGGAKLPPAVGDGLWRERHNNYGARRLSRGLMISYNLVPLRRLPEAVETAARIRDKLKLNGSVQAHLVDSTTAALDPYVLMDDTWPSGGTALGFVERMGDAAFKMDGHPMGLGLFLVFNLRKMHGNATSAYSAVKGVLDPRKKINGGKTFEVWTKYPWPGLRAIPPPGMAIGLEVAAILRRVKPTRDRFVRDDRVLPRDLIADLNRVPPVTVKVKEDAEVRKLVRVLNGQESTVSLGLSAEDYHYFRTQLGVGRTREFGVTMRPRTLLTYDWIVPEQRGVQLDFTGYAGIEFAVDGHRAIAQVGAIWKRLYDEASERGHLVPFVPTVPQDFAVGDALYGDAPFASFRGGFASYVNALRTISAYGQRARIGFEEVANYGTAYDLLHAAIPLAGEFFIPLSAALRLEAKPAARKTLTYGFDDPAKLSAGLDRLCRFGPGVNWVHITDAVAAKILRPATPPEASTVQVSLGATTTGIAAKEKALDVAMVGFKAKSSEAPNPYDVSADAYRKTADTVARSLFVG